MKLSKRGIPYYIFSYPNMELNIIEPEKNLTGKVKKLMRKSTVGYMVKTMSTEQNKCKLKHCFELHYGKASEFCLSCEEEHMIEIECA